LFVDAVYFNNFNLNTVGIFATLAFVMMIKEQINQDLKQALLSGDKVLATTLRGLKSAVLNVEIAENKRESGLKDDEIVAVLGKEAKKRQESADLYTKGGNAERAEAELTEKAVIEKYLPVQLNDDELDVLVDEAIGITEAKTMQDMGRVIGLVKQKAGAMADGGRIAQKVKERLSQ
jgi:uncharacterized protein